MRLVADGSARGGVVDRLRRRSRVGRASTAAAGAQQPAAAQVKFAFVTNNSAGFWNIAVKGMQKAEKDFGIKAEVFRPLKGELAEQQRYLEDVMVHGLPGHGGQPGQPRFDDAAARPGGREDAGHLPRLGRAQVQAQVLRRHQQRRGGRAPPAPPR